MTAPADDRLYDKAELAEWLGVPVSWVRDAITARTMRVGDRVVPFPITWIGRHARFSEDDRKAILAAGKEPAARTAPVVHLPRRSAATQPNRRRSA